MFNNRWPSLIGGTSGLGTSRLTFSSALNGINRVLNLANQAIPIYQKAKPLLQNTKQYTTIIKEIITPEKQAIKSEKLINTTTTKVLSTNQPSFFA